MGKARQRRRRRERVRAVRPRTGALERLQWLLGFVRLDLAALDEREWVAVWGSLFSLMHTPHRFGASNPTVPDTAVQSGSTPKESNREQAKAIQHYVRDMLEDLAHGRDHACNLTALVWALKPPA